MPGLHGVGGGGIFVTKFYFTENQGFVSYSSKYTEIYCLQHKTFDIVPPSVKLFSTSYMLNSKKVRYLSNAKNTYAYYSRVKITIFFMEIISIF